MTSTERPIGWAEYERAAPDTITALRALGSAVDESGLEKSLTELLKIRVSQLNGCAYCLHFHLAGARKAAIPQAKLDLLATWRDTSLFSPRERAALEWTEALTLMAQRPAREDSYQALQRHFTTREIAYLTASIAQINAWNRIAGGLRFEPAAPRT